MKQNISLKGLLLTALMLFGVVSVSAQSKLSIEPVNFASHDKVMLQVNFEKANPVSGMNFHVALPDFLEFAGKTVDRNPDRFTSQTTIGFRAETGNVVISTWQSDVEIKGDNGALLYIPVKVKDNVSTPQSGEITITNIDFTTWNGSESWTQDNVSAAVTYSPYQVEFTPTATTLGINAGATAELGVNIKSDCDIIGFQAVVEVPEGYTIDERAVLSDRCPGDANLTVSNRSGVYRLVYYTLSNSAMTGNEGLAFTLNVTAPADAKAQEATLTMKDIVVSYAPGKSINASNFSVTMVNGASAYDRVIAKVDGLNEALTAALAEIAEKYPDVKDEFTGESISTAIETLRGNVETAYADGTIIEKENDFTTECDAISAEIAKLITDAAAQEAELDRATANAKAYQETQAALEALMEQLGAAEAEAKEQYPDADVTEAVAAAQGAIEKATVDAEAAYNAVATEGTYSFTVDTEAIEALINAILPDAKAQQEEIERTVANAKAYQETQTAIQALIEKLEGVEAQVKEQYPDADVTEPIAAAQAAIEKATLDAEEAYAAVATEGTYSFTVDTDAIDALIDAILPDAKAQQEEIERTSANAKAYQETQAALQALIEQLEAVQNEAKEQYPDANTEATVAAAQAAIEKATVDAEAAYATVATEGTYNYTVDTAAIEALINAILPDAKAQQEEIERTSANAKAYQETQATLQTLIEKLEGVEAQVKEQYPDADVTEAVAAAQAAIEKATLDAEAAYAAVATEGTYSYTVPTAEINTLIDAIIAKAVADNEANRKEHNKAAYDQAIATLNALQAELDAAVEAAEKDCPHANITSVLNKAQTAITNARNDANLAYLAVDKEGIYNYTVDEAGIRALIEAVTKSATEQEAAYQETQRVAANQVAYDKTVQDIAALQAKLDAAKAEVDEKYPDVDVEESVEAAQAAIDKLTADAQAAFEAVAEEGIYSFTIDTEAIDALIAAVVTDAEAQQAELERTTANAKAYMETQTAIQALIEKLEAAEAEANELYPDADVTEAVAAANAAIEKATLEAEEAYSAVATEGTFEYTVDTEAIEALIAAVVTDAKAQQDEFNRQAANKAAYDADIETIDGLQLKLDEMKTTVATLYDDVDVTEVVATAQQAIDAARQAADDALAAVAEEGEYSNVVPVEEIEGLIKYIETYAKENGIDSIEADAISSDVKIYTLSGTRVNRAIKGAVNILVKSDGTASKVYVK